MQRGRDIHAAMLGLLRAGLWETEVDCLTEFPLTAAEWTAVHDQATAQTVGGVVLRGIDRLPDAFQPSEELLIRWMAEADRTERTNRRMNAAVCQLFRLFDNNGLHPVLMKGQGVAAMYEQPLLRECGDIDLYFPSAEEERRAAELMADEGCTVESKPDGSRSYQWHDFEIEHHTALLDLQSPFKQSYIGRLIKQNSPFCTPISTETERYSVRVPSPVLNLLMLNAHILKHVMGRGVGLRQFCDMARAYHTLNGQYSKAELTAIYGKVGMAKWSAQLHAFLTSQLGMPANELPSVGKAANLSPRLLRIVLGGGNFGRQGRGDALLTGWRRKLATASDFVRHSRFSLSCAPQEAFWTATRLMIGNIK